MYNKYFKYSIFLLPLYVFIACETPPKGPTHNIEFQIEEINLSEDEKNRAITNIQRRLESLGAENVVITAQKDEKITFSYRGSIKPQTHEKGFSVAGKLEFFEVCKEEEILNKFLISTFRNQLEGDEKATDFEEQIASIYDFVGISKINYNYGYEFPVFAMVTSENKEKVRRTLLEKEPFYISQLKKHIKFLLSKEAHNNVYELYAVCLTSENKAALDGSYVIDTGIRKSDYNDSFVIEIQMNEKGAEIWEQVTQHAYQTRGNIAVVVDNEVCFAPTVSSGRISGGSTEIVGNFTKEEAAILATAIRSGSIPKVKITMMQSLLPN